DRSYASTYRRSRGEAMTTKNIVIDSGNGIRGAVQSRGTSITEVPHPNHAIDRSRNLVAIVSPRDSLGRKNAPPQVYICDRATILGLCNKLRSPWKGPGLIVNILTPYLLEDQIKNRTSVVNHDHVKKCLDRELPKWLVKARLKLDEPEVRPGIRVPN
ncbi:hypothetical protein RRG08_032259, partial [Elysia crispata]